MKLASTTTIEKIQGIVHFSRIVCKVTYIMCFVTACIMAAGLVFYAVLPAGSMQIGNVSIESLVDTGAVMGSTAVATMIMAAIICLAYALVLKSAYVYLDHEYKAGTPFTFEGSREMLFLGLKIILIPLIANIICEAGMNIASMYTVIYESEEMMNCNISVTIGLLVICLGLLCQYGAENMGPAMLEENEPSPATAE